MENSTESKQKLPISAMAVTSLVIGCIALITALIPIVNNASFFLAALGIIFGIIGLVGILKKKKSSKVLIIVALAINVVSIIAVLASQSLYSNALNSALNESGISTSTTATSNNEVKVGETITLANGLDVTVNSVQQGLKNYDGSDTVKISVTYANKGKEEIAYNSYDWKCENSQGAQTSQTIYSNGSLSSNATSLQSGKLASGGTTSGDLYFKGDAKKILYSSSILSSGATATWLV